MPLSNGSDNRVTPLNPIGSYYSLFSPLFHLQFIHITISAVKIRLQINLFNCHNLSFLSHSLSLSCSWHLFKLNMSLDASRNSIPNRSSRSVSESLHKPQICLSLLKMRRILAVVMLIVLFIFTLICFTMTHEYFSKL